tara:strand:+ start:317 stop:520 length:204 start_codon:yes stop_codon:yes gene_type:complete
MEDDISKLNTVLDELAARKVIKSMAAGRRLLSNGGIKVDGKTIKENVTLDDASTITVGKKITIDLTA